MKTYKAILYKDFKTIGIFSTVLFLAMPFVLAVLFFFRKWDFYPFMYLLVISLELPLTTLFADSNQGWEKYSTVYPISRKTFVNFKFFELLFQAFYAIIIVETAIVTGNLLHGESAFNLFNLIIFSTEILFMTIMSVSLLFMIIGHKYFSIVFLCFCVGLFYGFLAYSYDELYPLLMNPSEELNGILSYQFHFGMIAVCAVVFAVFWILTAVLYKRRDI